MPGRPVQRHDCDLTRLPQRRRGSPPRQVDRFLPKRETFDPWFLALVLCPGGGLEQVKVKVGKLAQRGPVAGKDGYEKPIPAPSSLHSLVRTVRSIKPRTPAT